MLLLSSIRDLTSPTPVICISDDYVLAENPSIVIMKSGGIVVLINPFIRLHPFTFPKPSSMLAQSSSCSQPNFADSKLCFSYLRYPIRVWSPA